jgi:hypothetical protein
MENKLKNPVDLYPARPHNEDKLKVPGNETDMSIKPDQGETSYIGSEKLNGGKAIITGGDSDIGRAVAIAFAREGADVLISYLNENADAEETAKNMCAKPDIKS